MGKHSVSEADGRLAELIERARDGEAVFITEDGDPIAEIKPLPKPRLPPPGPGASASDWLDWLRANRVGRKMSAEDAGTLLSRMRDEEQR